MIINTTKSKCHVKIIGTGLGISKLLTIEAYNAIVCADIIVVDNVINKNLIAEIKHNGKVLEFDRITEKKLPVKFSNLISSIVKLYNNGGNIVRLKIGDALLFGETELETKLLKQAKVPVQIIPGLSTAAIAASRFGISITAKSHSNAVIHVIATEFLDTNKLINYAQLINFGVTAIIYMPEQISETIINNLLHFKVNAETPLIIVSSLCSQKENLIITNLNDSLKYLINTKLEKPYIIFLGKSVSTIT